MLTNESIALKELVCKVKDQDIVHSPVSHVSAVPPEEVVQGTVTELEDKDARVWIG